MFAESLLAYYFVIEINERLESAEPNFKTSRRQSRQTIECNLLTVIRNIGLVPMCVEGFNLCSV